MKKRSRLFSSYFLLLLLSLCLTTLWDSEAKRRRRRGKLPTHPVVLWAATLEKSEDKKERQLAAFKLSQYTQPIFRIKTINALLKCSSDKDLHIKVLCTKALSGVKKRTYADRIRRKLVAHYNQDPQLRNTIVRTFIAREDSHRDVSSMLWKSLTTSKDDDHLSVLLKYFEKFGKGDSIFANTLISIFRKTEKSHVKIAAIGALAERGRGQESIVALFAECAQSSDTPLQLHCLAGLESQAKKDKRAWKAVEKSIQSKDPDVLLASLDVINALPQSANAIVSQRVIKIIDESQDAEIREKAVLALGVSGDRSLSVVKVLEDELLDEQEDEVVRIAAALVLGKQAIHNAKKAKASLVHCEQQAKSTSLKTACQLSIGELDSGSNKRAVSSKKKK